MKRPLALTGSVGATLMTAVAMAGDLAPPAGPVAPTMKTLDEVEPRISIGPMTTPGNTTGLFVIGQPGSRMEV